MTHPIQALDNNDAKFAFTCDYLRDDDWFVTASGKGIKIGGVMWPVSQVRTGATTQYGVELFAAKWLLRERGMQAAANTSNAFNTLVAMRTENRRQGH